MRRIFALLLPLALSTALAAQPIKRIDIDVAPYYSSAQSSGAAPTVSVGSSFNSLLRAGDAQSLRTVINRLQTQGAAITPMTMMVLAIRLYDAGLRDEAAFWFYAAKDRFTTATRVLNFKASSLVPVNEAMGAFVTLAGPAINGYAFCDVKKQITIRNRAAEWVTAHPYEAVFVPSLPALAGDRKTNLAKGVAEIQQQARDEAAALANPKTLEKIALERKRNSADAKFCWK